MMPDRTVDETVPCVMVGFDGPEDLAAVGAVAKPPTQPTGGGWTSLFWEAFRRSSNPMVLLDDERRHVEVNGAYLALLGYPRDALIGHPVYEFIEDGPMLTRRQWAEVLSQKQFSGVAGLIGQDGNIIKVEFAGHPEVVTGQQLVLVVALKTVRGLRRIHPERLSTDADSPLSKRELEIVEMVAMGLTSSEIATELHVSHNTVRTHVRNAMGKLEARSRAHLVAKSLAEARHLRAAQ